MKTFTSEFAEATYAPECNAVIVIWKKQVTDEGFKATFKALLEILKNQKATAYISDINKQGLISLDCRNWLKEYIMPKAIKAGLKRIGTVIPDNTSQQYYMDNLKEYVNTNSFPVEFQHFSSLEDAIKWTKEPIFS